MGTLEKRFLFDGAAHGWILCFAGSVIVDGDEITISDGVLTKTFEFDSNGRIDSGNIAVPYASNHSATQVRNALLAKIRANLALWCFTDGANAIVLINKAMGTAGNQPITKLPANGAHAQVVGMAGGESAANGTNFATKDVEWIRIYNGPGHGQVAHLDMSPSFPNPSKGPGWIRIDYSIKTPTTAVVPGASLDGDLRSIWQVLVSETGIPRTMGWSTEPNSSSYFVCVKNTQFWNVKVGGYPWPTLPGYINEFPTVPALYSVQELLNETALQNLNNAAHTKIQSNCNAIISGMGESNAGGDYLGISTDFVRVPALICGPPSGSLEATFALVPGLSNFQPVNTGSIVFPKPFGPRSGNTPIDIFERAVTSRIVGASFADDFYWYHSLFGEVHCGTSAVRQTIPNWWTKQPYWE
jgi:hypothetical protein